ncbi:uncharacterized protein LOC124171728 isoform X2 [Ischnura elegans]|nr:uncharacterized protein LOC124157433 isoform X2 [Ischnura elegans]XP_046406951.1 uncharacterized protein LOC124171728 isoform X2 [Ischnura elegans]
MWTIIFKHDVKEHDCVPNVWLVTAKKCLYPDKSKATIKRMAKECAPPEDDWDEIAISIVKRDFDVFERAFSDVVRLETGKRSITSSENEERGKGKREKRRRVNSDELSSDTDIDERRGSISIDASPAGQNNRNKSAESLNSRRQSSSLDLSNEVTHKAAKTLCPLPKSRHHVCTFAHGETVNISIAKQLCSMSRAMLGLQSAVRDVQEQLKELRKSKEVEVKEDLPMEGSDVDLLDDKIFEILNHFPLKTMEDFNKFEERLKSESEFRNSTVLALLAKSQKTSYTRTTTSILRYIISNEIIFNFTWKGQSRKEHTTSKVAFHNLAICSAVMSAVKKKWRGMVPDLSSKLELCISGWFAQTQSKLNKK